MTDTERQMFELRQENSRLRAVKDEALEQAEQWKRAFVDAEQERVRLERLVKEKRS